MILAKKKYIKPITEVIIIDTNCQMLSGSGNTLHHSDSQTDTIGPATGGDEYYDDDVDLEAAKINYWALENTVLNI